MARHYPSAWARARSDTDAAIKTARFWFFDTILGAVVTAATLLILLKWGPKNVWITAGIPPAVGISWLVAGVLCLLVWHLFWAPYRQRDELRRATNQRQTDEVATAIKRLTERGLAERLPRWAGQLGVGTTVLHSGFNKQEIGELAVIGIIQGRDYPGSAYPATSPLYMPPHTRYFLTPLGIRVIAELEHDRPGHEKEG